MIDLHVHLVHAVDDGPSTLEEAVLFARQAAEQGIEEVVATPHVRPRAFASDWGFVAERYDEVRHALAREGIPLATRLAGELYYEPGIERLVGEPRLSLDGEGRVFLVEVSMQAEPEGALEALAAFARAGRTPLLAHPERVTTFLEEPERLDDYLAAGVLLQLNAGSLLGRHRPGAQALAEFLVTTGRAPIVSSDAHDAAQRPFLLGAARERIAALAGEAAARALVLDNPRRLLAGEWLAVAPRPAAPGEWPRLGRPRSWMGALARRLKGRAS